MLFILLSVLVPVIAYAVLPRIAEAAFGRPAGSKRLLALGGFLFFISWYLPSPPIDGRSTQFMTHLVGGGLFTGCVWLYLMRQARRAWPAQLELLSLYALVSALGVANELFEMAVVQLGFARLDLSDTSWDLVANTLGALLFWILYRVARMGFKK